MTYFEKLKIADSFMSSVCGFGWNDLPDINSLHDCETREDVVEACHERLADSGFPMEELV
jgi:hypothetical protein